jgi:hypothetical protein
VVRLGAREDEAQLGDGVGRPVVAGQLVGQQQAQVVLRLAQVRALLQRGQRGCMSSA